MYCSIAVFLPDFVCNEGRVSLFSVSRIYLVTTCFVSIAYFFVVSVAILHIHDVPIVSPTDSSHQESSTDIEEINSSYLPITPPFSLSYRCFDFMANAPGKNKKP